MNLNDEVWVRLTEEGRRIHRARHDELAQFVRSRGGTFHDYVPKPEQDGWSKWQLWGLFQEFGAHVGMGISIPFETEISFSDPAEPKP